LNDVLENNPDMLKIDQCGVCGGDASTCNPVVTVTSLPVAPVGYTLVSFIYWMFR